MPKLKAPRWLTTGFAEGVVGLALPRPAPAYKGALGRCWLAQHDKRHQPCEGPLERAHLIPRQRVEKALGALFDWGAQGTENWNLIVDLIQLAAWDPRNGCIACQLHHRRFDSHATPELVVPLSSTPGHLAQFVVDWGLEGPFEDRFPDQ